MKTAHSNKKRVQLPSDTETLVLTILKASSKYGLEIVDASDGEITRQEVYVTLERMINKGLVARKKIGPKRVYFSLTNHGEKMSAAIEAFHRALE